MNAKATRQRYSFARYQLVLDVCMWHMLRNCVCTVEDDNKDCVEDAEESVYVEDECMVCSNLFEYSQVQAVGNSQCGSDNESSDDAASLFSRSHGSCVGNLGDLDDLQFDALISNDMRFDDYHNCDGVIVENGDCATGHALRQRDGLADVICDDMNVSISDKKDCSPVDGQSVNADDDIGEGSREAASEELRPNILDPIFDSEDSDVVDVDIVDIGTSSVRVENEHAPLFGVRGPTSVSVLDAVDCDKFFSRGTRYSWLWL